MRMRFWASLAAGLFVAAGAGECEPSTIASTSAAVVATARTRQAMKSATSRPVGDARSCV